MTSINREPIELEFGGSTYRVKPSFRVLDAIEQRVGLAVVSNRLQVGDVRVSDLAWIVFSALTSQGIKDFDYYEVGEVMVSRKGGIAKAASFAAKLIEAALDTGPEEPLDDDSDGSESEGKG